MIATGAGTPITSPQLYSAYHTDDLRQALIYLRSVYPRASFHGIGFSLGANVLCRYLGEEGKQSRLSSGLLMGNVGNFLVISCFFKRLTLLDPTNGK
jgi:predicted alpha/beta-fold hydrolase